jgi:N6-adenosine-specific RNA methylase IME4
MDVRISDIKIGKRHRTDLGDIPALAASIEAVGLLHPVVLLPDNKLVVGARRVAAFKHMGRDTIPAIVAKNLSELSGRLRAEADENTCRKAFNPEEAFSIGQAVKAAYKPVAEAKQAESTVAAGKASGKARRANVTGNSRNVPRDRKAEEARTTGAVAAQAAGMDRRTFEKLEAVVASGDRKLIDEMNRTGKVNGAAKKLKVQEQAKAIAKEPPPFPKGPFRVIVIDPPWTYGRASDPTHRSSNPYPSMSIDQIKAMDIGSLAHKDSILWLWTTNGFLREAFEIMERWGFTYKTTLTWVKDKMGTGDWLRGKTEHCLMGIRGKPTITLTNQTTAINGASRKHSQKPAEFFDLVEKLCPGSKVEVFSREQRDGWEAYGDES